MHLGSSVILVLVLAVGTANASEFDPNTYTFSYDQYSATPTLVDAVAYRAILVLSGRDSNASMLASKIPMTDSDVRIFNEHAQIRSRAPTDRKSTLCDGIPENPTDNDVMAFGKRANALIEQDDVEDAQSYRRLLSELSPTAGQAIRDFVNSSVLPTFKTRRVDFARLLEENPSAFVVATQMICQSNQSSGELR